MRLLEKQAKVAEEAGIDEELGSFLPPEVKSLKEDLKAMTDEDFDKLYARISSTIVLPSEMRGGSADFADLGRRVDVPFSIGKPR